MSPSENSSQLLKLFAQALKKVPDPRRKRGSYPLATLLALTLLGLIAKQFAHGQWESRTVTTAQKA